MSDTTPSTQLPSVAEVRVRELNAAIETLLAALPPEGDHAAR